MALELHIQRDFKHAALQLKNTKNIFKFQEGKQFFEFLIQ